MTAAIQPGILIDNRFRIILPLGEGGMGSVYLTEQLGIGRPAAVKFLHSELVVSQENLARFEREAKALSDLVHPHITRFYCYGVWNQRPYFAMEYVEGETLQAVLAKQGALGWRRSLVIIQQVASALAASHKRGIIHRDLKPSNVFLVAGSSTDFVKVMDFGLARMHDLKQELTNAGSMVGSVNYMSPEMCRGQKADERCDIYALGCVLFELLTGRLPFEAETSLSQIFAHASTPPPRLEDVIDCRGIPQAISRLVHSCLHKDPDRRPASMDELESELETILRDNQNLTESVSSRTQPHGRRISFHPDTARWMFAAALITILGLLWCSWLALTGLASPLVAEFTGCLPAAEQTKVCMNLADWLDRHGQGQSAIELLETAYHKCINRGKPLQQLTLAMKLSELSHRLKKYQLSTLWATESIEILPTVLSAPDFHSLGPAQQSTLLSEVFRSRLRIPGSDAATLRVLRLLDDKWTYFMDSAAGIDEQRLMLATVSRSTGVNSKDYAKTCTTLAACYLRQDRFYESLQSLTMGLAAWQHLPKSKQSIFTPADIASITEMFTRSGQLPSGKTFLMQVLNVVESTNDPSIWTTALCCLAQVDVRLGDMGSATQHMRQAMTVMAGEQLSPISAAPNLSQIAWLTNITGDRPLHDEALKLLDAKLVLYDIGDRLSLEQHASSPTIGSGPAAGILADRALRLLAHTPHTSFAHMLLLRIVLDDYLTRLDAPKLQALHDEAHRLEPLIPRTRDKILALEVLRTYIAYEQSCGHFSKAAELAEMETKILPPVNVPRLAHEVIFQRTLAEALIDIGEYKRALVKLDSCHEYNPEVLIHDTGMRLILTKVEALAGLDELSQAQTFLQACQTELKNKGPIGQARYLMCCAQEAQLCVLSGQKRRLQELEKIIVPQDHPTVPADPLLLCQLARAELLCGDEAKASKYIEPVLAAAQIHPCTHVWIAYVLWQCHQTKAAENILQALSGPPLDQQMTYWKPSINLSLQVIDACQADSPAQWRERCKLVHTSLHNMKHDFGLIPGTVEPFFIAFIKEEMSRDKDHLPSQDIETLQLTPQFARMLDQRAVADICAEQTLLRSLRQPKKTP